MVRRYKKKPKTQDSLTAIYDGLMAIEWSQYGQRVQLTWQKLPHWHQKAVMAMMVLLLLLLLLPSGGSAPADTQNAKVKPVVTERVQLAIDSVPALSQQKNEALKIKEQTSTTPKAPETKAIINSEVWQEYVIQKGDTLSQVFRNNNLSLSDLNSLVAIEGSDKPLSQIQQGQLIRFKLAKNQQLDILQVEKSKGSVMFFRLADGRFSRSH